MSAPIYTALQTMATPGKRPGPFWRAPVIEKDFIEQVAQSLVWELDLE